MKNRMRPIAAATPSGRKARPAIRSTAPVVFNVPMGKVSQETGTPALGMPGKIGLK
jgi:hypothetical protein